MRKYVIMGPQGSGKGTQARLLSQGCEIVHIGVGDILRWHVQNHTRLGARVRRIMEAGELVPDDLVEEVVKRRLDEHDWNYGFVLDGFPRNATQARFFMEGYDIDAVILLDVPEAVVVERVLARRLCAQCHLDYNLMHNRPAVADRCDACGGPLVRRDDDSLDAVRARLRDYVQQTRPILELFQRKELVVVVDAAPEPDEVQAQIRTRLRLAPPAAVRSLVVA